jgi:type 1 fimbria pilin
MKQLVVATVLLSWLVWAAGSAAAQDAMAVQVQGRVVWIAGQTLVIVPDGSPSINIDLSQVPQEQHGKLREGDRIVVTGAVTNDRSRLVAASVERLTP